MQILNTENLFHSNLSSLDTEKLFKKGLDFNHLWLLEKIEQSENIHSTIPKWNAWRQTLERKGYLSDWTISEKGKELLKSIREGWEHQEITISEHEEAFKKWWNAFPSTDIFEYKGKRFSGSRSLRTNKEGCKAKIVALITSKKYTIEELEAALLLEVEAKKEASLKEGKNKLTYMHNSYTYLNQEDYEGFVTLIRKNVTSLKEPEAPKTFSI